MKQIAKDQYEAAQGERITVEARPIGMSAQTIYASLDGQPLSPTFTPNPTFSFTLPDNDAPSYLQVDALINTPSNASCELAITASAGGSYQGPVLDAIVTSVVISFTRTGGPR